MGRQGTMEAALLRIVDLHKRFNELEVLKGVDIDVPKGEKLSIIGPSGSGKTTLLRCINYLEKPSAGHIYIAGQLVGEKQVGGKFVHLSDRELAKERAEIEVIRGFLPRQMDEAEVEAAVMSAISEAGAATVRDMGKVMATLKSRYVGQMDFGKAGALVKAKLG